MLDAERPPPRRAASDFSQSSRRHRKKATLDSSAPARGAAEHHIGFTVIDGCISTWRRRHQTQLTMLDKKDGSGLRFAMIFARSLAPVINCMTQATMPTLNERAFVLEH